MPMITIPAAGQYGCVADAMPQELPPNAWTSVRNVRFRDGYAERFSGQTAVMNSPSVIPYYLTPYATADARFWVHAGLSSVFVDDGTSKTDITPGSTFTGGIDDRWTGGSLNGVLVLNNGVDKPQFWAGNVANDLADLTGWDSAWRASVIRPFKNFLIALDVTKSGTRYPHMVKWSDAAVPGSIPGSWDETDPSIKAGERDLADTSDLMVDCLPFGDINIIYKERSMYSMQFIGGTDVWRTQRLPGDTGMLTRGCAANTPLGHVVLTAGDVIIHSGQGPRSIITGRMRKFLFGMLDAVNWRRSFVTSNPAKNEVWVCIPGPGATACTLALVWNWDADTWTVRDLQDVTYGAPGQLSESSLGTWATDVDTWDSDTTFWNQADSSQAEARLLMSRSSFEITLVDQGASFGGEAVSAILERTGLALDDPSTVKVIRGVTPRVEAPSGTVLTIEVGSSMDAEKGPVYSQPVSYTVGSSYNADVFSPAGRFLAVRISSNSRGAPWRIKSFDLDVVTQGKY